MAVTASVAEPAGPDPVAFSNIRFDTGRNWTVVERGPRMVLRPTNDLIRSQARITIEPAAPFAGTVEAGLDAAWAKALGGRRATEEPAREEPREIEVGGVVTSMSAPVVPAGGLLVVVVKAGPKLTTLTVSADTDLARELTAAFVGPILLTLEVVPDRPPPPGAIAGPAAPGPDPSDSFDWDGPDEFRYGIYDHGCLEPDDEYAELVRTAKGFVGAVQPRTVAFADALATAKKLLSVPEARAQYDAAGDFASAEHPRRYVAGAAIRAVAGDPFGAMAQLLAGIDAAPDDPDVLLGLAAVLAEAGMPNESLAFLGRLRETGKTPAMAMGLSAEGAVAYLSGYDEMLRGKLPEAKTKLQQAIRAEPLLNEARRALSLVQAHEGAGGAGARTYLDGMWRFIPRKRLLCGGTADDSQRPSVDEMFDTSKGVPGKLVEFRHPRGPDDLPKFFEMLGRFSEHYAAIQDAQGQRAIRLGASLPQGRGNDTTPYDAWADGMSVLLGGLDEQEPLILKLEADMDASQRDAEAAVARAAAKAGKKAIALAVGSASQDLCPQLKDILSQGMAEARPWLVHYETMQRRYAKTLHRMQTGLNAHIGDPRWHAYNDAALRSELAARSLGLISSMLDGYGTVQAQVGDLACAARDEAAEGSEAEVEGGPSCPSGMRNMAYKFAFELPGKRAGPRPKLGFQVDCEKIALDLELDLVAVDGGLAEFGLGGFAQIEMYHSGEWSLFMGPRVGGSIGGSGASFKDGLWVKAAADGTITELGGRVSADATLRTPRGDSLNAPVDDMVFNLLPEPPKPQRGPRIKAFRGAVR